MANRIAEALASSSAHGISRAAASNNILLRLFWIIIFLCFFGLFCNSARTVVEKLINVTYITNVQEDQVHFKFPDIDVCPTNPISGSYPYSLNETEAALVNEEIERLGKIYDSLEDRHYYKKIWKAKIVLHSASHRVMELLYQRQEQSLLSFNPNVESATRALMYPTNHCFKLNLSVELNEELKLMAIENPRIVLHLFTDPYNSHFTYNGSKIKPIIAGNDSIPVQDWHQYLPNYEDDTALGYSLYLVPEGHFSSVSEATTVKLSPGHSYDIVISMEDVVFSKELHGQNCTSVKNLAVADPLTGKKMDYHSTLLGNFYTITVEKYHRAGNFVLHRHPTPWEMRHEIRLFNLNNDSLFNVTFDSVKRIWEKTWEKSIAHYLKLQPCKFQRYRIASLSSNKWPEFSGKLWRSFTTRNDKTRRPAIDSLVSNVEKLLSDPGNHSAHLESIVQNFFTDSMLKVSIGAQSQMSPCIHISYSYSWTSFLSEIGGLLGLYIGCSMLTVCELFELFYHLVLVLLKWRRDNRPSDDRELTDVATDANA